MSKWMDINTAPKDRRILLASSNGAVDTCFYPDYDYFILYDRDGFLVDAIAWQELPAFEEANDE